MIYKSVYWLFIYSQKSYLHNSDWHPVICLHLHSQYPWGGCTMLTKYCTIFRKYCGPPDLPSGRTYCGAFVAPLIAISVFSGIAAFVFMVKFWFQAYLHSFFYDVLLFFWHYSRVPSFWLTCIFAQGILCWIQTSSMRSSLRTVITKKSSTSVRISHYWMYHYWRWMPQSVITIKIIILVCQVFLRFHTG